MTYSELIDQGRSPQELDNRTEEPKDITDEYYHEKDDTITCPHCGCTLTAFTVMSHHYCYVCGGRFGERNLTADKITEDCDD